MKVREMIECHLRAGICMGIGLAASVISLIWFWIIGSASSEVSLSISVLIMVYYSGQLIGTRAMFQELVECDLVKLDRLEEEIEENTETVPEEIITED